MIFLYYVISIFVSWALLFAFFKLLDVNKHDILDEEFWIVGLMLVPFANIAIPTGLLFLFGIVFLYEKLQSKSYCMTNFLIKIFSLKG